MFGRAFGREAEYGHTGCDLGYVAGCACGGHGNLCEFAGVGVGNHCAVGEHQYAFRAEIGALGQKHHESARDNIDARGGLNHLEGGAQNIGCSVHRTGHLAVGVVVLDHQTAEIQGVGGRQTGFLLGHAFLAAEFEQYGGIAVDHTFVGGIDDCGFADIRKGHVGGHVHDFPGVAYEDDVGEAVSQNLVGGGEGARLGALGQNDAAAVFAGALCEFVEKCHIVSMLCGIVRRGPDCGRVNAWPRDYFYAKLLIFAELLRPAACFYNKSRRRRPAERCKCF